MVLSIYRWFSESTNFCSKERWLRPVAMMLGHVKIVNPCYFIATRGNPPPPQTLSPEFLFSVISRICAEIYFRFMRRIRIKLMSSYFVGNRPNKYNNNSWQHFLCLEYTLVIYIFAETVSNCRKIHVNWDWNVNKASDTGQAMSCRVLQNFPLRPVTSVWVVMALHHC